MNRDFTGMNSAACNILLLLLLLSQKENLKSRGTTSAHHCITNAHVSEYQIYNHNSASVWVRCDRYTTPRNVYELLFWSLRPAFCLLRLLCQLTFLLISLISCICLLPFISTPMIISSLPHCLFSCPERLSSLITCSDLLPPQNLLLLSGTALCLQHFLLYRLYSELDFGLWIGFLSVNFWPSGTLDSVSCDCIWLLFWLYSDLWITAASSFISLSWPSTSFSITIKSIELHLTCLCFLGPY